MCVIQVVAFSKTKNNSYAAKPNIFVSLSCSGATGGYGRPPGHRRSQRPVPAHIFWPGGGN